MLTQDAGGSAASPAKVGAALVFVVGLTAMLAWPVITRRTAAPSLQERALDLRSVEPYAFGRDVRFVRWTGPVMFGEGVVIDAKYEGPWEVGGFEMTVVPSAEHARAMFEDELRVLLELDEVQQINTFAGSEHCAKVERSIFCIGHHGPHASIPVFFRSRTAGIDASDDGMDAFGLLRTARKHWCRVFDDC
jgi:hypothetical protein